MRHFFFLLRCFLYLAFFEQLFLMFQTHIVDLHIGKSTILQRSLNSKSGIVGMYMYLDNIVIRNTYNRITYGL